MQCTEAMRSPEGASTHLRVDRPQRALAKRRPSPSRRMRTSSGTRPRRVRRRASMHRPHRASVWWLHQPTTRGASVAERCKACTTHARQCRAPIACEPGCCHNSQSERASAADRFMAGGHRYPQAFLDETGDTQFPSTTPRIQSATRSPS